MVAGGHQAVEHAASRSSASSHPSGSCFAPVFIPMTPLDEGRQRLLRSQHSSSSLSLNHPYGLPPPLSWDSPYKNPSTQMQPHSRKCLEPRVTANNSAFEEQTITRAAHYDGLGQVQRLSLSEDHDGHPTQRTRHSALDSTRPIPELSRRGSHRSDIYDGILRARPQDRLDPLSVLAMAGGMMDRLYKDRPP